MWQKEIEHISVPFDYSSQRVVVVLSDTKENQDEDTASYANVWYMTFLEEKLDWILLWKNFKVIKQQLLTYYLEWSFDKREVKYEPDTYLSLL